MSSELKVDTISEKTSANGVSIDGVKLKDSIVEVDTINESTSGSGVTIDGLLIKDGDFTQGTWTSTIEYSTTLTTTSGWSTTTLTGNYIKIGKLYRCSLPDINRSSMGLSAEFIVNSVSLPATTASNNNTSAAVFGYGLGSRYNTTVYADPQIMAGCGGSATKLGTQGLDTGNGSSGFVYVIQGNNGYMRLSWDFVSA